MVAYKGGACQACGYSRCFAALHFHHLDPAAKKFNVAGSHHRSWESLRDEVDKFVLLCANCHIEAEQRAAPFHRRRGGRPATDGC